MIKTRVIIISFLVLASFGLLTAKLFEIQIVNHNKFSYSAKRQQDKSSNVKAERGLIEDRNGMVLSYTRDDYTYYADLNMLKSEKKKKKVAKKFSEVFGKSTTHYLKLLRSNSSEVCLEKKAPKEKALQLSNFIVDGLIEHADFTRVYPYERLGSHVLGYVNKNTNTGVAGIEKCLDKELKGNDGSLYLERDVLGRTVSINEVKSFPSTNGNTVSLTINKNYQRILENELRKGIKEYEAKSALGIMMNPNTGEVLALSNVPGFNPNFYSDYSNMNRRNRAITDTYEPGSTIKSIVMSILLQERLVRENEWINTENGTYKREGARIHDTHKYERLTVKGVLEHSSNIGMSKLSDRIDNDVFYKYLRNFGFGSVTKIDLIGESGGKLKKPEYYSKVSKSSMSYGYEISVTPLQIINAYCALINGGYLLKPFVVKSISDKNGDVIEQNYPFKIRRVIKSNISNQIKNMMIGVVENGSGELAQLDNILIGGKTGTSKKIIDGKYSSKAYNSSFIGFFPADNPKVVCLVLIDSPQKGKYGGKTAAPVFKNVVEELIKTDLDILDYKLQKNEKSRLLIELFTEIEKDSQIKPLLSTSNINSAKGGEYSQKISANHRLLMPNLTDKSKRYAINILYELGLRADISGNGNVVSQSIKPGTKIKTGDVCKVECKSTFAIN